MNQLTFQDVLGEIDQKIHEIKKQCGPPPKQFVTRFEHDKQLKNFQTQRMLQNIKNLEKSKVLRKKFCNRLFCCCKVRGKGGRNYQMNEQDDDCQIRILEEKIHEVGKDVERQDLDWYFYPYPMNFVIEVNLSTYSHQKIE